MIALPYPHKALWPNGGAHRMVIAGQRKKHRIMAYCLAKSSMKSTLLPKGMPLQPVVTVSPKSRGPVPDRDNIVAACKAYFDGISEAIGVNDRLFLEPKIVIADRSKQGMFTVEFAS